MRYYVLAGALIALTANVAIAQNPDLALSKAERDSLLAHYHNRFPIWGRKAIERGFDLPYPVGLSVNGVWASQNIDISNLSLSTGDNPVVPIQAIKFGDVTAPIFTANLRADLWLLPFLNVYGFGGLASVSTDVNLVEPVAFHTKVDQNGTYLGLGTTATMGIKHNWLAFDVNWAWTQTEKLSEPVRTRIFSIRFGRAQKLKGTQRLALWVGAMKQTLNSTTKGSIDLSEVISGGGDGSALGDYQNSDWYKGLTAAQKVVVDAIAQRLQNADLSDVTVNYHLDKAVKDPWNMLVGASYEFNKRWQARVEPGFIGRKQLLLQVNYRFNW
ncbi:MAG TPA: hypothetical protein VFW03_07475 [Gemmatimonadaceae bacterium]|nr:hypothetical protein [Gemmatimonadaceae bacterium]